MSTAATIAIAVAVLVVLAAVVLVTAARRSDVRGAGALSRETVQRDRAAAHREPVSLPEPPSGAEVEQAAAAARAGTLVKAEPTAPAPWVPPDPETVAVTRRQFFNRASVTLMSVGLGAFGLAVIAFLWPRAGGGFGSKVNVGKLDELLVQIRSEGGFLYKPEARTWLTEYPADALPKAEDVYSGAVLTGMQAGINALYQKCPHLGCRVPECKTSQWFECPCHGSQYNRVGEKKAGPAPRGLDRFGVSIANGFVIVDTGIVFNGPPIGTNTTGQEAEGPHCITGGEGGH
jgi:cytochrome b6-f complex iron-sulfur subunit